MPEPSDLITPTGRLVLDASTMNTDRDAWLQARRWRLPNDMMTGEEYEAYGEGPDGEALGDRHGYRIGSSDVPSILDLPGVGTPVEVWRDKVQGLTKKVVERMTWGHLCEPVIAEEWCRRNRAVIDEIGLVAHADKPWHQSTVDRRVRECPLDKNLADGCALEVKNVGFSSAERWGKEWPDRITAQLAHQRFTTGYQHIHVAALIGGNMMAQGVFGRTTTDQEIQDYVIAQVDQWRERYLLTGIEPPWSELKPDKMIAMDKASHPVRAGEATVQEIGLVMEYAQASAEKSAADKRMKHLKVRMAQVADGAELVLFGDNPAWSYRAGSRASVDLEKLAERYPDAAADPEVVRSTPTQTLVIPRDYRVTL